jgi:hypothetical protein
VFQDQEKRLLLFYFHMDKAYIWSIETVEKVSARTRSEAVDDIFVSFKWK